LKNSKFKGFQILEFKPGDAGYNSSSVYYTIIKTFLPLERYQNKDVFPHHSLLLQCILKERNVLVNELFNTLANGKKHYR
jgi:hypothetical protein